jgi:FlaA1/EpsC-like NDP-sugar epimerase
MDHLAKRISNGKNFKAGVVILMIADVIALLASLIISFLLRFDSSTTEQIYNEYMRQHIHSLPIVIIIYLSIYYICRLYRYAWRFASLEMLWGIIFANTLGLGCMIAIQSIMDGGIFPRSILVIYWMTSIVFIGAGRILLRMLSMSQHGITPGKSNIYRDLPPHKVVILGSGTQGARILRGIREDTSLRYEVVGFLDDKPESIGTIIGNAEVLGPISLLDKMIADHSIDDVIIALPESGGGELRKYVLECRKRKIPVKIVPYLRDMLNGKTHLNLEDFSVEDLLRRPPVKIDLMEISGYVTGKRILVTGAGGSIGSELCRQISEMKPASLILLGHGENSIFEIHKELKREYPELSDRLHWVIASISDKARIDQVFNRYRPQVVFHAAAHKHVPIMENNLQEAVNNNVIGTYNVAQACGRFGVKRMALISTDKAANPASVMGATKWLCEQVVLAASEEWPDTSYVTVRFGNVLGSRGSVVPLFKEQIQKGGPVTVTHPEMTRYFMTIPEAVQLVLQASAVGKTGDLYLLDMGNPVKIVDLARDMISLYGKEPDIDIAIVYTGIRQGEKLHEQLATEQCEVQKTEYEKLSIVLRPESSHIEHVRDLLVIAEEIAHNGSEEQMETFLNEYVPGFADRTDLSQKSKTC